jgi:hypothetical protein
MDRAERNHPHAMIDALSLLISHGVILLAAWRLLPRADLDRDSPPPLPSASEPPSDA